MNDLEFKHQVLDTKSASFCAAKWYNATIWLGSGMTTSCHHPPAHLVDKDKVSINPGLLHNTDQKKEDRRKMIAGERPAGCEYCWKIEDMGSDAISDRVYKSKIYPIKALDEAFETPATTDVNLRTLEIAFDRTCQFACSYCNPAFSSTWVNDIRKNGPYINLVSDGRGHFTHTHDNSQLYKFGETNPYVEAFFRWWESDLHSTLTELRITGGEPLMSGHTWQLIDWFKQNQGRSNTRLAINTNLGREVDVDRLLESTKDIELDIYTSNETITAQAEYIRDGLDWPAWIENIEKVANSGIRGLHIMCTINALCLPGLPAFITTMMMFKQSYGRDFPSMSFNILRFPSFQSAYVLPLTLRTEYAQAIEQIVIQYRDNVLMHEHEVNQLARLVAYLREPVTGPDLPRMQNDFKQFYAQYDQRRGKNFIKTFPELKEFYEQIP